MADIGSSIFNERAAQKLRNPDDLDKYLRVTNPSVWVALIAFIALIIGLLAWGIFGSISTSVGATGVSIQNKAMCFLNAEDVAKVHIGDESVVGGEEMQVESSTPIPKSREEVRNLVGNDYLVASLMQGDWAYVVQFTGGSELDQGIPVTVSITTERIAPISLIFR